MTVNNASPAPDHKTGLGQWNGGACVVKTTELLTGVTTASQVSQVWTAPFPCKIKQMDFDITDGIAASAYARLRVNGTTKASVNLKDLATGLTSLTATAAFASAYYQLQRGDRVTITLQNVASVAGRGIFVVNPI